MIYTSEKDFGSMYLKWVEANIDQYKINDNTYRITLPFFDFDNDFVDIYIIKKESGYFLTDDGATLSNLRMIGFDFNNSQRRKRILESIMSSFGVNKTSEEALYVEARENDLPLKKHLLAQCMIKVSDMGYLNKTNVQSLFLEDVQAYLDQNEVRYVSGPSFIGRSKLVTNYDFVVPSSKQAHERFIKVVNNFNNDMAKSVIFTWNDIIDVRKENTVLYTFIQDDGKRVSEDAISALQEYGIIPALWSKRSEYVLGLTA